MSDAEHEQKLWRIVAGAKKVGASISLPGNSAVAEAKTQYESEQAKAMAAEILALGDTITPLLVGKPATIVGSALLTVLVSLAEQNEAARGTFFGQLLDAAERIADMSIKLTAEAPAIIVPPGTQGH